MRRLMGAAAAVTLVLGLGACGLEEDYKDERGRGDAPVEDRDDTPKQVINFPNDFSNVAHACGATGHRVYVTTQNANGKQMAVIEDESCD